MTTIVKHEDIPVISHYTVDDALEDGTIVALTEPEPEVKPVHLITGMDQYLMNYGEHPGQEGDRRPPPAAHPAA